MFDSNFLAPHYNPDVKSLSLLYLLMGQLLKYVLKLSFCVSPFILPYIVLKRSRISKTSPFSVTQSYDPKVE